MLVLVAPGDYEYSGLHWWLFVLMAILEIIVLLNLLIAIISDTFERV